MDLGDRSLEELVLDGLVQNGWAVAGDARNGASERIVQRGSHAYALEFRVWKGKPWKAVLRALFADAALSARARSAAERSLAPLAVVAAANVSDGMAADLARYCADVAPDVAWGLVDQHGRFELHGDGFEDARQERRADASPPPRRARRELPSPFSDLGQWALKVLLAPEIESHLLDAPRQPAVGANRSEDSPVRNVRDLARRAGISEPRASDIVAALERQGFVERRRGEVALVRRPALLEAWRAAAAKPAEEFGACFARRPKDPSERLRQKLRAHRESGGEAAREPRAALGLFAASAALNLSMVRGAPLHVLVEDSSPAFLDRLGLHRVEEHERADVLVRRPDFPECAFRGCVIAEGVPVADVLQLWLDVSAYPARGREQADEILAYLRVLGEPN